MNEQTNTQNSQPYQITMVPVMIPAPLPPKPIEENKTETPNVIAGIFWAVVILLAGWFIAGGWEMIR